MICSIVKDLLPNHVDGLNSDETSAEVSKHLSECPDCRAVYEKMSAAIPENVSPAGKNINFILKLKRSILKRGIAVIALTCVFVLGGLILFARNYEMPIPFDARRMSVELIPVAVVYNNDGSTHWWNLHGFYSDGVHFYNEAERPVAYEYIREALHITWQGFSRIATNSIGRDIIRDGEHVRVVFYRHTKTPWVSLFFDYDLTDWQEAGRISGTTIYGDRFQSAGQEPQRIEIFYLPVRNLIRLHNFSDEDFDAERLNGTLVWSGIS